MELFEENSVLDLVCRGYSQTHILENIGVDVGYHANGVKAVLKGVDRTQYKIEHVRQRRSRAWLFNFLDKWAKAELTQRTGFDALGLAGAQPIALRDLFTALDLKEEFFAADKAFRNGHMKDGMLEKYGTDNPFKLDEFQAKAADTRERKYGGKYTLSADSCLADGARNTFAEHMKDEGFHQDLIDRREKTCVEKYGENWREDFVTKAQETAVERYGADWRIKAAEKSKQTCMERYGVESHSQLPEFREKMSEYMKEHGEEIWQKARKTCVERYGVPYYCMLDENRETFSQQVRENYKQFEDKRRQTCVERYGVPYYSMTDKAKADMSRYMHENQERIRKNIRETSMERYGVPCYTMTEEFRCAQSKRMLNPDYQKHIVEVKQKNGTLNSSSLEEEMYLRLVDIFGEDDVVRQYKDERYPFFCDFYIKSRDLFIEVNGSWTHGFHWFDKSSIFDNDVLKRWKKRSIDSKFYKQAINVWTERDVNKRSAAAKNDLNYLIFWGERVIFDVFDLWVALGMPSGKDWQREYSWLPDIPVDYVEKWPNSLKSSSAVIAAVHSAQWPVFYANALTVIGENVPVRHSPVNGALFSNRYKYLGKLPDKLTANECLQGMAKAGFVRGFSSFNVEPMLSVINEYNVSRVYDPCAGWGERALACGMTGVSYTGCDVNHALKQGHDVLLEKYCDENIGFVYEDASCFDMTEGAHDAVITCPPYGNLEIYSALGAENLSEDAFYAWWGKVVSESVSDSTKVVAYQIDKKHAKSMDQVLLDHGFVCDQVIPANVNSNHFVRAKNGKRVNETMRVFVRKEER